MHTPDHLRRFVPVPRPSPGQVLERPKKPESAPASVDFSSCRSLEEIIKRLLQAEKARQPLTMSDGRPYTAKFMAGKIDLALDQARKARGKLALEQRTFPKAPRLSEDELDGILASNGITSSGGLREVVARLFNAPDDIQTDAQYLRAMEQATDKGKFNPIWKLNEAAFIAAYPIESQPRKVNSDDDNAMQIAARWSEIKDRQKVEYFTQLENWRKYRETVSLPADRLVNPGSTDSYAQYAQAQAPVEQKYETAKRLMEESARAGHTVFPDAGPYDFAIANEIGKIFTAGVKVPDFAGVTTLKGPGSERANKRFVRTLVIPLEGRPGKTMTVNLFSQANEAGIGEKPQAFTGVIVEDIGGFSTLGGGKPEGDQVQDFSAAYRHIRQVEDQVRTKLGLDLGVAKDLANRFAPQAGR